MPRDRGAQPRTTGRGRASSSLQPPSYREPACPAQLHGARRETSPVGIECVGLEQRLDIAAREPQRLSDAPAGQCAVFDEAANGRAAHPQMTDDLRDGEERLQTKLISQMTSRLRSSSCFRTGRSCLSGTVGSRRISWFTGGRTRSTRSRPPRRMHRSRTLSTCTWNAGSSIWQNSHRSAFAQSELLVLGPQI